MALSNENLELCTNARFVADALDEFAGNKRHMARRNGDTLCHVETLHRWADNEAGAADMIRRLVAAITEKGAKP